MEEISNIVLENWGISGEFTNISETGYSGSKIYIIKTHSEKLVLKGYPTKITEDNILAVHNLLLHLRKEGFDKVPNIHKALNNKTSVFIQERQWEILSFVNGTHVVDDLSDKLLRSTAQTIARFHKLGKEVSSKEKARTPKVINKQKFLESKTYLKTLQPEEIEFIKNNSAYDLFSEFFSRIEEIYKKFLDINWEELDKKLSKSFIHSDLTKKNIFFNTEELSGIIDFESTKFGPRIWDIARIPIEFSDCEKDVLESYLNYYSQVNPLNDSEKQSLYSWIASLNIGVHDWAIHHSIKSRDVLTKDDQAHLIKRVEKAILIMRNMMRL